jgi:hypothetical protein
MAQNVFIDIDIRWRHWKGIVIFLLNNLIYFLEERLLINANLFCINICVLVLIKQYCTGLFVSHNSVRRKNQFYENFLNFCCNEQKCIVNTLKRLKQKTLFVQRKFICLPFYLSELPPINFMVYYINVRYPITLYCNFLLFLSRV